MQWIAEVVSPKPVVCVIERQVMRDLTEQKDVIGYYLYAYNDVRDIPKNRYFLDDLQDTLEWAKAVAQEEFGVPLDAWREVIS